MKVLFKPSVGIPENHNFEFCKMPIGEKKGYSDTLYSYITKDKQAYFIRDTKTKEVIEAKRETIYFPFGGIGESEFNKLPKLFYIMPLEGKHNKFAVHYMAECGELETLWANYDEDRKRGYNMKELKEIFAHQEKDPRFFFKANGYYLRENVETIAETLQKWFGYDIKVYQLHGNSPTQIL